MNLPATVQSVQCNCRCDSGSDCRRQRNEPEHFTWIGCSKARHKSSRVKADASLIRDKGSTIEMYKTKFSRNWSCDHERRKSYLRRRLRTGLSYVSADRNF